jgi:DNA repair protein RecN (Recombination protein N)
LDESYVALVERLENLSAEAEDLGETFADLKDGLDFDEGELEEIESRLDAIKALKRKYGANKEAIDEYLQKSKEEYALLSDCEGQMIELTAKREKLGKEMYAICKQMTAIRKEKGKEFSAHICKELQSLNISSPQFEIEFEGYEVDDVYQCSTNGLDRITFLFSANAGEPLKPLGKIISGGEMSRFMLAMKTQLTSLNEISTYIFDEIDAGISGKTAKVVAEKFARISKQTQIISVSHLPQICAMSDLSIYIEKEEEDGKTLTKVHGLSDVEKEMEVVRLLGGEAGDGFARQHAKELIEKSNEYKLGLNAG